jgi:hypothetical protein
MPRQIAVRTAVVAAVVLAAAPVAPSQSPTGGDTTSYLDAQSRLLVERARARRRTYDASISEYTTSMKERIGMGIRALRRDRMLYHREMALRITWRRDSLGQIDVVGAREGVPVALKGERLPEDLVQDADDYAFDPSSDRLSLGSDSGFIIHPLAPGAEAHYRYQAGDSTALTFPDGRRLRLYELRIIPRRPDAHLVAGALWIEGDGYGVVRLLTRLARPFDFEMDIERRAGRAGDTATVVRGRPRGRRGPADTTIAADATAETDGGRDGDDDIPGFLKPIRAEVRFFAVEYGLWDDRWWLPRLISFDAVATVARFAELPLRYELVYEDYRVTGDTAAVRGAPPERVPNDTARARCKEQWGDDVSCRCRDGRCFAFTVAVPPDTAALLASAELPAGFRTMSDTMLSEQEIADLADQLRGLPGTPWLPVWQPPRWGLFRYNRVEALSLGARGEIEAGPWRLDGLVRLGVADLVPNGELGVERAGLAARTRLAGYYRLAAADTTTRPFGLLNSSAALFFGRDDGDYFRALGVELAGRPALTRAQGYSWRVYAERQRPVAKETDVSLPWVFDRRQVFRANIAADTADQIGLMVQARATRSLGGATIGSEIGVDGAAGTFAFVRSTMALRLTTPLPGPLTAGFEVAGGTARGDVPVQSLFYLGGPYSLRGYDGGTAAGEEFWRARVELANDFPAARLALFADAGKAAPVGALATRRALLGVGVGASFLDGLVRIDVARATRAPLGWRVDVYFDGVL